MKKTRTYWLACALAIGCLGLASCGGSSSSDDDAAGPSASGSQPDDGDQDTPTDEPGDAPPADEASILDLEASDWALLADLADLGMDDVSGPAALVDGTVWMGAGEGIFLIDPESRTVTSTVPLPDGNEGYVDMVVTDSSVIVTTGFGAKTMYVIDRETQEIAEPVTLPGTEDNEPDIFGFTTIDDRLYAQSTLWNPTAGVTDYSIVEIDPTDGSTIETFPIEIPEGASSPEVPHGAAGLLWYGGGSGNTGEHYLYVLDPESGTTEQIEGIDAPEDTVIFESNAGVVVPNYLRNVLVLVDPETLETSEIELATIGSGDPKNYFGHLIVSGDAAIVSGTQGGFEVVDLAEQTSLYDVGVVVGGSTELDGIIVGDEFWVHNGGSYNATRAGEIQAQIGGKEG